MAFEALIRRYERPLFGFIVRNVGDASHAPDLYQQTLLQILARIDTVASPEAFAPWAFGVASNLCRNYHRARRARSGEEPLAALPDVPSPKPDPERSAQASEARESITRALGALPDVQREVFVLYHYSQLTYDEIAVATSAPVGTVKSRMNAALVQLRSLLAGLAEDKR